MIRYYCLEFAKATAPKIGQTIKAGSFDALGTKIEIDALVMEIKEVEIPSNGFVCVFAKAYDGETYEFYSGREKIAERRMPL